MRRLIISSTALLALGGAASAADMAGRITFVDPDESLMILNSSDKFTLGARYEYFDDARAAFMASVISLVDAGGCDIKVYPGFVEANSYRSAAQLPSRVCAGQNRPRRSPVLSLYVLQPCRMLR